MISNGLKVGDVVHFAGKNRQVMRLVGNRVLVWTRHKGEKIFNQPQASQCTKVSVIDTIVWRLENESEDSV